MYIFVYFLIIIGIILILVNYKDCNCNDNVVYRFNPTSLHNEVDNPKRVTDIFNDMYYEPEPWLKSVDSYRIRKREDINQHFITQF